MFQAGGIDVLLYISDKFNLQGNFKGNIIMELPVNI